MKTLSKIALLFAAASLFALASCQPEEKYSAGSKEDPNCYDVYFPVQDALKGLIKDPSEPTTDIIKVSRTKTEGEIIVPLEVVDPTDSVFTVTELKFEDGQADTSIVVTYDKAAVGTEYTLQLRIKGDEYASKYGTKATVADFSVIRVLWKSLGNGLFCDNDWFTGYEHECEFQVRDDDHSYYRVKEPYKEAHDYYESQGKGAPLDEWLEFRILKKGSTLSGVEITKDDLVYFNVHQMGFLNSSYGLPMEILHPIFFTASHSIDGISKNCVLSYQDEDADKNIYPAIVQLAVAYYMEGLGGWNDYNVDGGILMYFPGVPKTDYTLEIESSEADASGVLPVLFTTGVDIDTVKYEVFEGALTTGQINSKAKAIAADPGAAYFVPDPNDFDDEDLVFYTGLGLTLPETKTYTLVAIGVQDSLVVATASNQFNYLKAGDDVPFAVSASLESTKKYEALGTQYSSDSILVYYAYADSSVTTLVAGIYENKTFVKKSAECWKDLLSEEPALAVDIIAAKPEDAFGLGLEGIEMELIPGTEYVLLVYASNGYKVQKIAAVGKTTGVAPLPIYKNFTYASADASLFPDSPDGFYGTYNLYAVDLFGTSTLRDYIGKSVIDTLDVNKYSPREEYYIAKYGYDVAWLTVSGFSGSVKDDYNLTPAQFDDNIVLGYARYHEGEDNDCLLYIAEGVTADSLTTLYFANKSGGWNTGATDYICGYPVLEGYIAFVYDGTASTASYGWNGLGFVNQTIDPQYILGAYKDYLLVDPAKDDNGIAPSTMATIKKAAKSIKSYGNCVETFAGARKSRMELARNFKSSKLGRHEVIKSEPKSVDVKAVKQSVNVKKGAKDKFEGKKSSPKKMQASNLHISWQ